jgi:hypothetical protein
MGGRVATVSTNRGGRPKDWTEPRKRRLVRLYLYTRLSVQNILSLLEEDEFKPGYVCLFKLSIRRDLGLGPSMNSNN